MNLPSTAGGGKPGTHDRELCGINAPGEAPVCPVCAAEAAAEKLLPRGLRADLKRIAARFDEANRRLHKSRTIEDYADAEDERRAAAGEFYAAEYEIAHLGLMLLRLALRHEPDALRLYLADALRPEFQALAASIAKGVRP
jgi:hypothetical protein